MSNKDAELALLRKMDQVSVANLFGVPLFKLNSMEDSSVRANLEEQNRDYFNTSLSRWLNRFSEEAVRKLLSDTQRASGYYYKWVPEAFLKGDIEKRYSAYSSAIASRIMSPNEAREKEDMEPYDGGDEYLNPAIESAGGESDAEPEENKEAENAASRLLENRHKSAIDWDINTVRRAAQESKNFTNWVDDHYSEGGDFDRYCDESFKPVRDLLTAVGLSVDVSKHRQNNWRTESKRRLFKLCDQTTADRLVASVREELETWKGRI